MLKPNDSGEPLLPGASNAPPAGPVFGREQPCKGFTLTPQKNMRSRSYSD